MAEVGVRAPPAFPGPGRWDGRHDNDLRNSERQGRARHRRQPGDRCSHGGAARAGGGGCGRPVRGRQGDGLGRRTAGGGGGGGGRAPPGGGPGAGGGGGGGGPLRGGGAGGGGGGGEKR